MVKFFPSRGLMQQQPVPLGTSVLWIERLFYLPVPGCTSEHHRCVRGLFERPPWGFFSVMQEVSGLPLAPRDAWELLYPIRELQRLLCPPSTVALYPWGNVVSGLGVCVFIVAVIISRGTFICESCVFICECGCVCVSECTLSISPLKGRL